MAAMQNFFLLIFTLAWSSIVLMFDGMTAKTLWKQIASRSFASTSGNITHSEVKTRYGSKGSVSYSADLTYVYTVGSSRFTGKKLRFNSISSSDSAEAWKIVITHPEGSTIDVYYNPAQPEESLLFPGVNGADLIMFLFLAPFNAVMIGFWIWLWTWLRERLFRPVAGGVKILTSSGVTRVRLLACSACWWGLGTFGVIGFVSTFIVGFGTNMHPSIPLIVTFISVTYGTGLAAYFWQWRKINSGVDDLILNESANTMQLPLTCGRKAPVTIDIQDIKSIWVEQIVYHSSRGGASYTYAPNLRMPKTDQSYQKLAEWSDKLKADDFAQWLGKKISVPVEEESV